MLQRITPHCTAPRHTTPHHTTPHHNGGAYRGLAAVAHKSKTFNITEIWKTSKWPAKQIITVAQKRDSQDRNIQTVKKNRKMCHDPDQTTDTWNFKPALKFQTGTRKNRTRTRREKIKPGPGPTTQTDKKKNRTGPRRNWDRASDRTIERPSDRASERSSDRTIERPEKIITRAPDFHLTRWLVHSAHFSKLIVLRYSWCSIPTKKTIYKQESCKWNRTGLDLKKWNPDQTRREKLKPRLEGTTRTRKNKTQTRTVPDRTSL